MLGKRGSMMVFLRGLPEGLKRKELKAFVQASVRSRDDHSFYLKAKVCNCAILRITDRSNGDVEHHGLVEVQPARAAIRAIDELNGTVLKGTRIQVRRYRHRSPLRDGGTNTFVQEQTDSRPQERRRSNLKIDLVGA